MRVIKSECDWVAIEDCEYIVLPLSTKGKDYIFSFLGKCYMSNMLCLTRFVSQRTYT